MKRRPGIKQYIWKSMTLTLSIILLFTISASGFLSLADFEGDDTAEGGETPELSSGQEPSAEQTEPGQTGTEPAEPDSTGSGQTGPESNEPESTGSSTGSSSGAGATSDDGQENEDVDEPDEEELEDAEDTEDIPTGTISGFLWVDGNGMLTTDWDGIYNIGESPLVGFDVYLYYASDIAAYNELPEQEKVYENMPIPIVSATTGEYGTYLFYNLVPGSYVIGLTSAMLGSMEYLLPMVRTEQSVFDIDWETDPLMAYSDVLVITEDEDITDINAGMRLPMGIMPTGILEDIGNSNVGTSISIDNQTWFVVRHQGAYTLLLKRGYINYGQPFGRNSYDVTYEGSLLQSRITSYYTSANLPTIKAIAVVPTIGNQFNALQSDPTYPTPVLAGNQTKDIMFALSYRDVYNMPPVGLNLPNYILNNFPGRSYTCTRSNDGNVWGMSTPATTLDGGLSALSSNVYEYVAVWVGTGLTQQVTVRYVDANGLPIGSPSSVNYSVVYGNDFSLAPNLIPTITGYDYSQWRLGTGGALQSGPVFVPNVRSNIEIYLVYTQTRLERYLVYDGQYPGGTFIDSYHWLADAVTRCGTGRLWTIVATEHDYDVTNSVSTTIVIPENKIITLTSDARGPWSIRQPLNSTSHLRVSGTLTMRNVTLTGGGTGGGLIVGDYAIPYMSFGTLILESGAIIENCLTSANGGGIGVAAGEVTINGGIIRNNRSININGSCYGGGIWINQGTVTMNSGEIRNNQVSARDMGVGGGVYLSNGAYSNGIFRMNGGTILSNTASHYGGGVYVINGGSTTILLDLNGGSIVSNSAGISGGGVFLNSNTNFTMGAGVISGNSAANNGGGVFALNGTMTLNGGTIGGIGTPNTANNGGGICAETNSTILMNNGTISYNRALDSGGGVNVNLGSTFTMKAGFISYNEAVNGNGGAVQIGTPGTFTMDGGTINGNTAKVGGGAILTYGTLTLNGGTISSNTAGNGGGVSIQGGSATMTNATIQSNKSLEHGGGVYMDNGAAFTMNSGRIIGNEAVINGGGIYVSASSSSLRVGSSGSSTAPEISGNKAGLNGGGIWTANYALLQIASNAVFGRAGTASANTAASFSDYYPTMPDFTAAFQTRYTPPVGIYTPWGQYYSTAANHPVNNYDINAIVRTVTVSYVNDQTPPGQLDSNPPNGVYMRTYLVGDGASFRLDNIGDRIIPAIDGHVFKDWTIGSPTATPVGNTTVLIPNVNANTDIYLIYMATPASTLTITKHVAGIYALRDKVWEFTVYFASVGNVPLPAGTEFDYTITNITGSPNPQTGKLTLIAGGSAKFNLKHNQQIVIAGVPLSTYIRIVETTDNYYTTSYIDSNDPYAIPVLDHDTGGSSNTTPVMRVMTANRVFAFLNTMRDITETGLEVNTFNMLGLTMLAGTSGLMYFVSAHMIRRMRRSRNWKRLVEY